MVTRHVDVVLCLCSRALAQSSASQLVPTQHKLVESTLRAVRLRCFRKHTRRRESRFAFRPRGMSSQVCLIARAASALTQNCQEEWPQLRQRCRFSFVS
jgi:hypothetical protein